MVEVTLRFFKEACRLYLLDSKVSSDAPELVTHERRRSEKVAWLPFVCQYSSCCLGKRYATSHLYSGRATLMHSLAQPYKRLCHETRSGEEFKNGKGQKIEHGLHSKEIFGDSGKDDTRGRLVKT